MADLHGKMWRTGLAVAAALAASSCTPVSVPPLQVAFPNADIPGLTFIQNACLARVPTGFTPLAAEQVRTIFAQRVVRQYHDFVTNSPEVFVPSGEYSYGHRMRQYGRHAVNGPFLAIYMGQDIAITLDLSILLRATGDASTIFEYRCTGDGPPVQVEFQAV